MDTAITDVRDGQLFFGHLRATDCADKMTLEEVAAHHWQTTPRLKPAQSGLAKGDSPLNRAMMHLAQRASDGAPLQGQSREEIATMGAALMEEITTAYLGTPGTAPIHTRLGHAWNLPAEAMDLVRRALVLMSDHELNPSSFAVRVCASTGGPLAGALLAGLATLSGPRHGGVADLARQAALAGSGGEASIRRFLASHQAKDPYGFGYGHPLYPDGDPRAAALMERIPPEAPALLGVQAMARHLNIQPNIDAALAVLTESYALPKDAGFAIFFLGRLAGWIAHAMEQSLSGQIIRPRARFAAPA